MHWGAKQVGTQPLPGGLCVLHVLWFWVLDGRPQESSGKGLAADFRLPWWACLMSLNPCIVWWAASHLCLASAPSWEESWFSLSRLQSIGSTLSVFDLLLGLSTRWLQGLGGRKLCHGACWGPKQAIASEHGHWKGAEGLKGQRVDGSHGQSKPWNEIGAQSSRQHQFHHEHLQWQTKWRTEGAQTQHKWELCNF